MNNLIKPLTIRSRTFASNLIQGPLAGFTCAPMRVQTWRHSKPAYCSTEMVSATHLAHTNQAPKRYTYRHPQEGPVCFQLSASDSAIMARATQIVDQYDVDLIELNCGCPVQKIRGKGAGSKLLANPEKLQSIVTAMRENTDKIVSVKIRVAGDKKDQDNIAVAQAIEQSGADVLVVHGRHWTEHYDHPCRYDQIANIVQSVNIPVIGNGNVHDQQSLQTMLATGCAGVMIARASMGQPWLFEQLEKQTSSPDVETIGAVFIDHIEQLSQLDNPFRAILQARKIGKYYARNHLIDKKSFIDQLNQCTELDQLKKIVELLFR